jgi:signal transduction histidine kinase/DNA-binding response OmpR family regulator
MKLKKIIFYLVAAFIAGNIMLLFIHYNSNRNVNSLIDGNKKILAEIDVIKELRELNKDIATIEGRNRAVKLAPDSNHLNEFRAKIETVQFDLDNLQKISDDDSSEIYIDRLDLLVHEKLNNSKIINDQRRYYVQGSSDSAEFINRSLELNDSIRVVTHQIENSRQKLLLKSTLTTEKSGRKALYSGTLLIVIVLFCGIILFLIIINRIVKQHGLIQKLDVSEKKVRESVRIKELFIANMSHEIRTPMNAIVGFTNLLQKRELDEESKGYVKTIQQSSEALLAIINNVLDLSKIEADMMHIDSYPFSLSGLFGSVVTMFKSRFEEKGIKVLVETQESLPDILDGDPARLTQILMNLIGNALKFTNRGSVIIKISNEGMTGDYIQVGILVQDTGIGIQRDKLPFIFDRFRQAEDSITRKYGGTGLGLAIVEDLVTIQKGSISVESEPGKGTSFKLIIPYKLSTGDFRTERVDLTTANRLVNLSGIEILVVEDNEINKLLLTQLFKNWEVKYDVTGNGKQAIEKLKNKHYSIILMDIQMPVMDGYTATREIRENLGLKTPIIAMTAHAMQGEREKCLGYGMNDYIAKPIHEVKLQDLIVRYTGVIPVAGGHATPTTSIAKKEFEHIDLTYMTQVSNGNIEYEREVTAEFLAMIPQELNSIWKAWSIKDTGQVRKLAHNMKTTVSIMGLSEKLRPFLDELEYEELNEQSFDHSFDGLGFICEKALEEANLFYVNLPLN